MADDWQPGDLALCVNDECDCGRGCFRPRKQGMYNVVLVIPPEDILPPGEAVLCLALAEDPEWQERCWWASSFRKINPLTDAERDEELYQIKRDAELSEPAPEIEVCSIDAETWWGIVRG